LGPGLLSAGPRSHNCKGRLVKIRGSTMLNKWSKTCREAVLARVGTRAEQAGLFIDADNLPTT
jgi:hypothetical protein